VLAGSGRGAGHRHGARVGVRTEDALLGHASPRVGAIEPERGESIGEQLDHLEQERALAERRVADPQREHLLDGTEQRLERAGDHQPRDLGRRVDDPERRDHRG